MNDKHNPKLKNNSQQLRKNMTKEERHLWYDFLKQLPYNINRQKVIGNYIVDFYCAEKRIVIELDGGQHFEEKAQLLDKMRDEKLMTDGIAVLRYTNADVNNNFEGVCQDILLHLSK